MLLSGRPVQTGPVRIKIYNGPECIVNKYIVDAVPSRIMLFCLSRGKCTVYGSRYAILDMHGTGCSINMEIKRRIRSRVCKELVLCYLISTINIKLRLLEYILCKR